MAINSSPWSSKGTVFGVPNSDSKSTLGFGIFSTPSSASTTSSIFGTGTSNAFQSTGFGVNSTNSFGVPKNPPTGFTTGTSHAFPSTTSVFGVNSTNTSGFPFGTNSLTEQKSTTGSRKVPYKAILEKDDDGKVRPIQSISRMPDYTAKSHEELRWEDYELKHIPFGPSIISTTPSTIVPSSSPFSQTNIFRNPLEASTPKNPFGPSTIGTTVPSLSPFSQTSPFSTQPLSTLPVPSPNPFSLPQTNPNPSQPQPFIPSCAKPNPFSTTVSPSTTSPFTFGPFSNTVSPSTTSSFTSSPFSNTVSPSTQIVGVQSTLVADPFPTRSEKERPNTVVTTVQHGISSLPSVSHPSTNRSTTSLRIRHVSPRLNSLPPQHRYTTPSSSERKVAFFENGVDRPGPLLPRENPRAWVTNSLPFHSSLDGKCCEEKDLPSSSPELKTCIQEETEHFISISHQNDNDDSVIVAKKHEDDVLALVPKLPIGDEYYTEPSLTELAAKEIDEPGSLSRVNDFVVGKSGYGSIKFLGETDIRCLDLGTIVQFKNREVIVYADEKTKPVVGEGMNKAAEVTLLNVKCVDKKTGKQYVDGPRVESYKEMLMKKGLEQRTEFVSYDPVQGEWRFRVQHF